jgi:uncharacterized protein
MYEKTEEDDRIHGTPSCTSPIFHSKNGGRKEWHENLYNYAMNSPKPNLGLRILRFPLTRLSIGFFLLAMAYGVAQTPIVLLPGLNPWLAVLEAIVASGLGLLLYIGFARLVEGRAATELTLRGAAGELGRGVLLGAVLFSATIGVMALLGLYRVDGLNAWQTLLPAFALAVLSGVFEELIFRGVLFRIIEQSLGTWLALVISALIFGLLHLANPNATLWAGIAIAIEAGILLAAAYLLTRRLWLAIGIHFAWNFTQGGIFNVAVSGNQLGGLLRSSLSGPDVLSGGSFGAEASVIALFICLAAGAYLLWRARDHWLAPFWVKKHTPQPAAPSALESPGDAG